MSTIDGDLQQAAPSAERIGWALGPAKGGFIMADMSRRSFIASMGAVAGAAALAGCGSTGGNTASTTEAA